MKYACAASKPERKSTKIYKSQVTDFAKEDLYMPLSMSNNRAAPVRSVAGESIPADVIRVYQ